MKKVARQLLDRLKSLLVLDWRARQSSRARVEGAIEELLVAGLPRAYTPELQRQKCSRLLEHSYEAYLESGAGCMRRDESGKS